MTLTLDPAIHISLRTALALLFVTAAIHKLRDVAAFSHVLRNYRLLPDVLTPIMAGMLIATELGIAVTLLLFSASDASLAAAALLATYAGAIGINLARGRQHIDCGCAGRAQRQSLSRGLVLRNLVLCVAALATALPPATRTLASLDGMTIAGALAFLCLMYATVNGLLANAPRLNAVAGTGGVS